MQSAHASVAPPLAPPPWPGAAAPFAHPDRLGLFGALHGLATAETAHARVLEIGCRAGANLLPLAAAWPGARFVGLEPRPDDAQAAAAEALEAGLGNVSIIAGALAAFVADGAPALGQFDYVVAHGVLARLGPADQRAFWELLRRTLAPHGVALVSVDTWPGQHVVEPLRRLMRFHVAAIGDPVERVQQARAIARFHIQRWHQVHGPTRGVLYTRLLDELDAMDDRRLADELLADEHHPRHFDELEAEARAEGFVWVANARASEPRLRWMPSAVRAFLAGIEDLVRQQQYMDFFVDQRFRTALLCRADAPLKRQAHVDDFMQLFVAPRADWDPEIDTTLPGATAAPRLSRDARFLVDNVVSKLAAPTRAAQVVERALAAGFAGEPLEAQVAVTELFFADAIELARTPPPVLGHAPEADTRPLATVIARRAAARGEASATSLWHRDVGLLPVERQVLARCDGTTTADVIVEAVGPDAGDALDALHRYGFLMGRPA